MDFASLPHRFGERDAIGDLRTAEDGLEPEQAGTQSWRIAGRVLGRRGQGGVSFIDLEDMSGRVQLLLHLLCSHLRAGPWRGGCRWSASVCTGQCRRL